MWNFEVGSTRLSQRNVRQERKQLKVVSGEALKVVSGEATKPVKRRKKDGEQQDVDCPLMISSYNKYMGGVDRNDQMKSY